MSDPRVETLPDGRIRINETCDTCSSEVVWTHIAIADDGRTLIGHCLCLNRRRSYHLGIRDRVVDEEGRRL